MQLINIFCRGHSINLIGSVLKRFLYQGGWVYVSELLNHATAPNFLLGSRLLATES